jgi:DNA polymerase III epsilon subunit-like protein
MKILVFDTETTGLPCEKDASIYNTQKWPHIIQLSYILYNTDNDEIITIEDDYINIDANINISKESQEIHNITREMLDKGINIIDALEKFNYFSSVSDLLVGHNISFDKRMIFVEGIRNKIHMNITDTYCTMKNCAEFYGYQIPVKTGKIYYKYPKLNELYKKLFNKIPKNTHNSLIDVLLCLRCFCQYELKKDVTRTNRTLRYMIRQN